MTSYLINWKVLCTILTLTHGQQNKFTEIFFTKKDGQSS
jgi:hypothetical protein